MKPRKYESIILSLINDSQSHMTAEQLFLVLKEQEPKVSMASVYNNLNTLYQEGKIQKVSVEGQPDHYDKAIKHDHLVCKKCGKLSDITFGDLTAQLEKQMGGTILGYDLKVLYLCPECRKNTL